MISSEDHRNIERLGRYLEAGDVVPATGDRFDLADVPEAIRRLEAGLARGKSVVVVAQGGASPTT